MPNLVWCSGFDFGSVAGIATGNATNTVVDAAATPAVTTSNPRHGAYSLHLTGTGVRNVQLNSAGVIGGGQAAVVASGYIRFPGSLPSADVDVICIQTLAMDCFLYFRNSDDKLVAVWETGTEVDGPVVVADVWYPIDLVADCSTGTSTLSWRVGGADQTQATFSQTATTISNLTLGRVDSSTAVMQYDSWVASVTAGDYPLGEHRVVTLTPDQSGTITVNGSTANWGLFTGSTPTEAAWNAATGLTYIDEIPLGLGASADGIYQIARTDSTHYIEIPMTSVTLAAGETVSGVRMLAAGAAVTATTANIGFRSWNGTTETVLFPDGNPNFDNSALTPGWVCKMLTLADVDTQSELDALAIRMGFSSDVTPHVGIHAMYVEVAIKLASPAPATVAAVTAIPAPTVSTGGGGDADVSAATVAAIAAVPAATVSVGSTLALATVTAVAAVDAAAPATGSTISATTVAGMASVPAVALSTGSTIAAATVAAVASAGAPDLSAGSTIAATTVAAVASVDAATVSTSGDATATPSGIAAIAAVPAATPSAGVTLTLATVAGVAALASVAVSTGSTTSPATVAAVAGVGSVSISTGAIVPGTLRASLAGSALRATSATGLTATSSPTSTLTPS